MNKLDLVIDGTIFAGLGLSLVEIQSVMGVMLLTIQIVLILVKLGIKLVNYIKKGKVNEAIEEVEKAQDEISKLKGGENANGKDSIKK